MQFVRPADVEANESTPGLSRQVIFETEQNVMVRSSVESGTSTGWHHHCDRHACGYLLGGSGRIEFGSEGDQHRDLDAPLCLHLPPETIHREIAETDMEVVVNFVGTGPLVEDVEGPERPESPTRPPGRPEPISGEFPRDSRAVFRIGVLNCRSLIRVCQSSIIAIPGSRNHDSGSDTSSVSPSRATVTSPSKTSLASSASRPAPPA